MFVIKPGQTDFVDLDGESFSLTHVEEFSRSVLLFGVEACGVFRDLLVHSLTPQQCDVGRSVPQRIRRSNQRRQKEEEEKEEEEERNPLTEVYSHYCLSLKCFSLKSFLHQHPLQSVCF